MWFDAHLDLSYLALGGRDMGAPLAAAAASGGLADPAVTLPSLRDGGVRWCCGTIFTEAGAPEKPWGYADGGEAEAARRGGVRQLEVYREWESRGLVRIVRGRGDLGDDAAGGPLRVVLLMEGADPIRDADDARWWFERGVRVVGLSWRHGSRYAGGDATPPRREGLTPAGRELVRALDGLGVIHDLTHLDDASAAELLDTARSAVVVTHTASRSLMASGRHRLVSDELARRVGERGGMLGLVLYSGFLAAEGRASPERAAEHAQRLADLAGGRDRVGLGSDMDGGIAASSLVAGIDAPADLPRLAAALARAGWSPREVAGFERDNWLVFLREHLQI